MSHATGQLMSIHVGQCGNQIGQSFWKTLCDEHAIDGYEMLWILNPF